MMMMLLPPKTTSFRARYHECILIFILTHHHHRREHLMSSCSRPSTRPIPVHGLNIHIVLPVACLPLASHCQQVINRSRRTR